MGLQEYKRKRHFDRTPEPAGTKHAQAGRSFVVQKHAASHLHYDFRLELDGVLKSWAVPKGPSLDPSVKRLAMHVEDHPVEYGSFEGIIPQGEYGGGTVMLWDQGEWEPVGDPDAGYRAGRLKFRLDGQKLRGLWVLVRTGGRNQSEKDQRRWLLFKERDEEAVPETDSDVLEEKPLSVTTGRNLDEIAMEQDWIWGAKPKTGRKARAGQKATKNPSENGKPAAKRQTRARKRVSKSTSTVKRNLELARADYDAARQEFAGVRLTHPDKVLYPDDGITKLELAQYYREAAQWILPHLADRPLVLVRCPEGNGKECFFQKHPRLGTPETLRQIPVRKNTKTENYLVADDEAGLISLVQISALEIHAWGSRADRLEQPDRLVFDLDPDPALPWARVVASARQVREFLNELGLQCFVKTTGGKGLHVVLPIDRRHGWDEVKAFCKGVADLIVKADPNRYTANMAKSGRHGKIFIDYLRNGRGATAIVPYSTRAKPGAPISVPLTWEELDARIASDHFTIRNIGKRLASLKRDPWRGIDGIRQGLGRPIRELRALSRSKYRSA
jgi:bifunctional non-homologous end joining protein LigD